MQKTTCSKHRTMGYCLKGARVGCKPETDVWICRGCGLPESRHETIEETAARKAGK